MIRFLFVIIYISCKCFLCSFAQTPVYKNYVVADGLPSQTVYSVMQDKKNYIWISTDAGVSRFDGIRFKNFRTNDGLTDNEVFHIFEDSKGRLWFVTFNGKPCYFFNDKFYNPGNDKMLRKVKTTGPLHSFYEDCRHSIWLGTSNSSVASISDEGEVNNISFPLSFPSSRSVYFYEQDEKEVIIIIGGKFYAYTNEKFIPVEFPRVSSLHDLGFFNISRGKAVYVSDRGIELLDRNKNILLTGNPEEDYLKNILNIYYDKHNDDIWLTSYQQGAILLQKNKSGFYSGSRVLLTEKGIIKVFCDNENNTWFISTGNGIYKFSALNFNFKSFTAQDGLEQSPVNCIRADSLNNLWLGFNNGIVNCIDPAGKMKKFDCSRDKKRYVRVLGIEPDRQNNIWVGTDDGVLILKSLPGNTFQNPRFIGFGTESKNFPFKSFAFDRNGNLFVTYSHGIGKIEPGKNQWQVSDFSKAVPFQRTYAHFFDHANNLWISNITGLCLLIKDSLISFGLNDELLGSRMSQMAETADSTLVLATYGFGVLFFKNGKIVNRLSESDGLAGNICKRIFINEDTIYVASIGGLSRFIYRNNVISEVKKFTVSEGLLSNAVNDVVAGKGQMYVATSQGLSILPENFQRVRSSPPAVYITELKVNGIITGTLKEINLDYNRQYLRFSFIAPVFDRPENVIYSYNMGAYGAGWTETKNNTVEFSSIVPGEYIFSVKAKKDNSEWSTPALLKFTVTPPFWKTRWFYIAIVLFFGIVIYLLIYYRIARIKKTAFEKTELNRKIAGLEMKALRAQMNPHFIFNVMNSIQNYIVNNDSTSALRYLSKFAKLIRIILDNSQSPVIKLSEEVSALEIYLELEKVRFKEKFDYAIITDSEVDTKNIFIPSMLLQPYVENAIKHGIRHKEGNGKVSVTINKNKNVICCVIEDDGVGRAKSKTLKDSSEESNHVSLGSEIALHRVEAYNISNNANINVTVEDVKNKNDECTGTKVLIQIPV